MADFEVEPVDADLDDLVDKYPVGSIVAAERVDDRSGMGRFHAVVTGHSVVEQPDDGPRYKYPGPRVNVSTSPPGFESTGDRAFAAALRPCEAIEKLGEADPTDD